MFLSKGDGTYFLRLHERDWRELDQENSSWHFENGSGTGRHGDLSGKRVYVVSTNPKQLTKMLVIIVASILLCHANI